MYSPVTRNGENKRTVMISDKLHRRLKVEAAKRGMKLKELISVALMEFFRK